MPPLTDRLRLGSALAFALAASACAAQPLRPYTFAGALPQEGATTALARALDEVGRRPALVDPRAGVIVTSWADSGYRFHETPPFPDDLNRGVEKYLFRRYHVAVLPGRTGTTTVRLQAEVKRCSPPVSLMGEHLVGQCQDAPAGFRSLQRDLDSLGQHLRVLALERPASGHRP